MHASDLPMALMARVPAAWPNSREWTNTSVLRSPQANVSYKTKVPPLFAEYETVLLLMSARVPFSDTKKTLWMKLQERGTKSLKKHFKC